MDSKNPILRNALQRLCPSCNIIVNINQHVCKCGYRLFDAKRKAQPESQAQANIKRSEKKHIPVVHGTPSNPFPCSHEVMKPPVSVVDVIPQNINESPGAAAVEVLPENFDAAAELAAEIKKSKNRK
nr:uncharacterized protein LOC123748452 isoform X3 [Procambarus clarkii]